MSVICDKCQNSINVGEDRIRLSGKSDTQHFHLSCVPENIQSELKKLVE
jgi:hypothetical protein